MVEGWQPVHVSISVAALLFPATIGESVGSQWGAAADLLRRRRCRDIFPHLVCTPVEASPHSTYTLFAQIKPEIGYFLTKFTISAYFGHHAANITESMQAQASGRQNDDKNDDR